MTEYRIPRHPLDTEPYQLLLGADSAVDAGRELLHQAFAEAGVDLGAYDQRIARWLGTWEASTAVTVASWIARAYDAGRQATAVEQRDAMVRVSIPIRRLHADGSPCTHKLTRRRKPQDGEDCPGIASYQADCKTGDCRWTYNAGTRAIVEDQQRTHRGTHTRPVVRRYKAPIVARHGDGSVCRHGEGCADVDHYTARCSCRGWSARAANPAQVATERQAHMRTHEAVSR